MSESRDSRAEVDFGAVTPDLLARYDRPGPRYTSYPTAPQFDPSFGQDDYVAALQRAATRPDDPLSLYIHVPFCEARCTYCGCSVVISPHRGPEEAYIDAVARELDLVSRHLGGRKDINQLHWGGGTPTFLTPAQCQLLFGAVASRFRIAEGAEVAIEVDPCVTTAEHVEVLRALGFNRISMGVQDLDPQVQRAVRREQPLELTRALVRHARRAGFASVNLDLIYGLPYQTPASFARTVETVIAELDPDRVAVFSYAHVPWIKPHQKALEGLPLPHGFAKFEIFAAAADAFLRAGYRFIGMDHFAKPNDELARALDAGTLHRNFMGYTVLPATDQIGVGVTSIGDVGGCYVQNEKNLSRYQRAVLASTLPVERGLRRSPEDELRGAVIRRLMATFSLDFAWVRERFGVDPETHFSEALRGLSEPAADGLVVVDAAGVRVLPAGRPFIRNLCMPFDAYLRAGDSRPLYSRTV